MREQSGRNPSGAAARERITGVLCRHRQRKSHRNWLVDYGCMLAEDAGIRQTQYHPETGWVRGDEMRANGTSGMTWSISNLKPFGDIPNGTRVSFFATVRRWDNGLGGDIARVRGVVVEAAAEVSHG